MRVGLDGFPLGSQKTGVGHYTFELACALARIAPSDEFELVSPIPFTDSLHEELKHNSPSNLRAINPRITALRRRWWAVGLPLYLRRASLDLFHGTNYEVPLWNRRRAVVTIHDLSILLHPDSHPRPLVPRARHRLPLMARSAAKIITVTESMKREICDHLGIKPEKVAVTPEAPRRTFWQVPVEQTVETRRRLRIDDEFILFVGTIEPRKNLLTLVRAFDYVLRNTSLRPQLVIAGGEGWLMDELFSFVDKSGIGARLRFTGYLTDEDLRALYSSCRICIYPSLYEGFGLPPLEAMACGAPVIASRIPALVETLGSAARMVDPADVQALARGIIELWEDQEQRRQFSSAGLQRAATFSWETTARLTLEVYHEVLQKTRNR